MPDAAVIAVPVPGADPLDELAGLPLALRSVLTLQKEGATRIALVVPEDRDDVSERILRDRRVKAAVELVRASAAAGGLAALLRRRGAPIDPPDAATADAPLLLVARHHVAVDPAVYRALKAAARGDVAAAIAARNGEPVGPLVASPAIADVIESNDLDAALRRLLAERAASPVDIGAPALWAFSVTTPEGRRGAFEALFEACRKPVDGIVARHINRHISIFISKRLVRTPLTPNIMSIVTFLLGVLGAVSVARGGYWYTLLGAFLFQWNSILDGVDGELARVRFQHSKLGQWLDTVSDDLSNILFYAGLTVGAAPLPGGRILVIAGWVGIVASALTTAQYYTELVRVGSGDLYAIEWGFDKTPPQGIGGKLLIFFRYVVKKDFAILFFLALAVVGVLPYALVVVAGGAVGTLIAATLRTLKKLRK